MARLVALFFTLLEEVLAFRGERVEAEALGVLGRALSLVGFRLGSALVDLIGALFDVLAVHLGRRVRRPCRSNSGLCGALRGLSLVVVLTVRGAIILRRRCCRLRGPRRARLGAGRRSHEAILVRVVAQAGSVLGSTLGLVGIGLSDAGIVGGGAVCGAFIWRGAPVGESSGDEGRDDNSGTHLEGVD